VTSQNSYSDIGYALLMKIQQGTMAYRYRGLPLQKNPFDLALYLRLLDQAWPRTLIEIGAYRGGSALWFADQASLLGLGLEVLSIDLEVPGTVTNPSVNFLQGDASELESVPRPRS
jgi:cephalosporin hydroxylase